MIKFINRGVAQLARALAWGARGRRGRSGHPDMKAIATEIQKEAKRLRREGKSHREIAEILNVGLGTAFYYTRGIRLTDKQHRHLVAQSYNKGFGKLTADERRLASIKGGINNSKNLKQKYSRDHLIALLKDF